MRIWKRISLVMISFILLLSTKAIVYATESEQIYVGDFNLYTYRADLYLDADSICNKTIQNMMTQITPSELIVEQLNSKGNFQKMVNAWKVAHYATSPSEIAEGGIDEKGYYTAIILSVFKAQTENEHYVFDVAKSIHSNTNKILSNTKKLIKGSDEILLNTFHRNQIINTFTIEEQSIIRAYFEGEFKETHPILNKYSTVSSDIAAIFNVVDTFGEAVELMESYVQMLEMSESMKVVLMDMYNQCPENNVMMKEALYEAALSTESLNAALNATFLNAAGKQTTDVIGVLMDEGWEALITSNIYAKAFMVGAEVGTWLGDTVCNTLFSTDKTIEQYEKMKCLCEFTDLLKITVTNMGNTYLNGKTTENAANYFASIDALISARMLSCDFANNYKEILYEDAALGWVAVSKASYDEYVKSVNGIKKIYEDDKDALVISYLYSLEGDYPEIYKILMGLDKEEPILVTGINFENDEIVIGLDDTYIYNVGVVNIAPLNATNQKVTFTSSDTSIVQVNEFGGWLTPYRVGTAYITATSEDGGYTDVITVQVVDGKSENSAAIDGPRVVGYGMCGENVEWTYYDDGLLVISGSGEMEDYHYYMNIPWYGYHNDISKVKILSGINCIGDSAFDDCNNLRAVEISEGVTSIGDSAFSDCENLTTVEMPSSVTSIGHDAFYNCENLTAVKIPSSVTSIGNSAFSHCYNLTTVEISEGVTSIGSHAFSYCNNLTTIEIPSSVTSMGSYAFCRCDNLIMLEISEGVTSIGMSAFSNCHNLTTIEIPSSVTSIGSYAFDECYNLTTVEISEGVTDIGSFAFSNCYNLTTVEIPSSVTGIGDSVFFNCDSLITVEIPSSVTSIEGIFHDCDSLITVEIPSSVTSIGSYAFSSCDNLTSIEIPSSVTSIGSYAFSYCNNLISIEIPLSVTSIGDCAFRECDNLTTVEIPSSVTSIAAGAFYNCDRLEIYGNSGSYAESYAKNLDIPFICVSEDDNIVYTVNFNANGGTNLNGATKKVEENHVIGTLPTVERDGYTFKGWYTSATGGTKINENTIITADTTYYAQWEKNVISIENATVNFQNSSVYDGTEKKPTVTVNVNGKTLSQGTDYTVTYSNCVEVGSATITITGIGNYTGSLTKSYNILRNSLSKNGKVTLSATSFVYDGNEKKPTVTVTCGNRKLNEGSEYTVSYTNNKKVGTATVTITGVGNYSESISTTYTINKADISKADVVLSATSFAYDGEAKQPTATVKLGNKTLTSGTDYTVSYANNTAVGTATVTIAGKGNYTGSVKKTYTIGASSIEKASVTLSSTSYVYDGMAKQPTVIVKLGDKTLKSGTDYTVAYTKSTAAGTATVTITGKGNYAGTVSKTYTITAATIKNAKITLSSTSYNYDGKEKKPSVTVMLGDKKLGENDYSVTYKDNKNIGNATVTIKGKGNYTGTVTQKFKIKLDKGKTFTSGKYKYKVTGDATVAFNGIKSTKTTKVSIPKAVKYGGKTFKVTSIADKALKGKTKVTQITIGANVKTIGVSAFEGCKKLSKVTIGSAVITIEDKAFKSCMALKKVMIPVNVTKIDKQAFYGCKNLKTITIKSTKLKTVGKEAFKKNHSRATIKVPKSKLASYKKLLKGKGQGSEVTIVKY